MLSLFLNCINGPLLDVSTHIPILTFDLLLQTYLAKNCMFRMKDESIFIDSIFRSLEEEIATYSASYLRPPCGNMRSFFLNCIHGPLLGVDTHRIHLLCDDYEHARHHYENFDEVKFKVTF